MEQSKPEESSPPNIEIDFNKQCRNTKKYKKDKGRKTKVSSKFDSAIKTGLIYHKMTADMEKRKVEAALRWQQKLERIEEKKMKKKEKNGQGKEKKIEKNEEEAVINEQIGVKENVIVRKVLREGRRNKQPKPNTGKLFGCKIKKKKESNLREIDEDKLKKEKIKKVISSGYEPKRKKKKEPPSEEEINKERLKYLKDDMSPEDFKKFEKNNGTNEKELEDSDEELEEETSENFDEELEETLETSDEDDDFEEGGSHLKQSLSSEENSNSKETKNKKKEKKEFQNQEKQIAQGENHVNGNKNVQQAEENAYIKQNSEDFNQKKDRKKTKRDGSLIDKEAENVNLQNNSPSENLNPKKKKKRNDSLLDKEEIFANDLNNSPQKVENTNLENNPVSENINKKKKKKKRLQDKEDIFTNDLTNSTRDAENLNFGNTPASEDFNKKKKDKKKKKTEPLQDKEETSTGDKKKSNLENISASEDLNQKKKKKRNDLLQNEETVMIEKKKRTSDESVKGDSKNVKGTSCNILQNTEESNKDKTTKNKINKATKPSKKISNLEGEEVKNLVDSETKAKNKKKIVAPPKGRFVVFLGNLPFDITKEEVEGHFQQVGTIRSIRLPLHKLTNKPKGFGFLEVTNQIEYEKSLSLHGTFIRDRKINVLYTGGKKSDETIKKTKLKNFKLHALLKKGKLHGGFREKSWHAVGKRSK